MTWGEFISEVNDQLSVEANRRGLEAFRNRFIRNAVIDLQRYIPGYRQGNTTTYLLANVVQLDQCSLVQLPDGAKPTEIYQYSTNPADDQYCKRYRLDFYPWESRQDLICGKLDFMTWWAGCSWPTGVCPPPVPQNCNGWNWVQRKGYVYTIAPHGKNFLVYPPINDSTALLLLWDGYKSEYADIETIPFPHEAAEAVAAYLRWKLTIDVDKNPALAREYYAFWKERRLSLYRDWQETQDADKKGEEYGDMTIPPPTNFSQFGAQNIPLLPGITALEGSTVIALANITTVYLAVPFTIMIIIGGVNQLWTLKGGTDADDPTNGIVRPNDYNGLTNAKVWSQSTV